MEIGVEPEVEGGGGRWGIRRSNSLIFAQVVVKDEREKLATKERHLLCVGRDARLLRYKRG